MIIWCGGGGGGGGFWMTNKSVHRMSKNDIEFKNKLPFKFMHTAFIFVLSLFLVLLRILSIPHAIEQIMVRVENSKSKNLLFLYNFCCGKKPNELVYEMNFDGFYLKKKAYSDKRSFLICSHKNVDSANDYHK